MVDWVERFLVAATVPRAGDHKSGTLEQANSILSKHPEGASANIYCAAALAEEKAVAQFLARDPERATAKGGVYGWDALTYLCFSRFLRLDAARAEAFVSTARLLLEAGASANTGWIEMIDHPNPRPLLESALYGAAGVARQPGLTRLLLEYGADPNDEETPYHVPEGYDNTVLRILLESGKVNAQGLEMMLVRKADWHDYDGMKMVLAQGGAANGVLPRWGHALHHAVRRDNSLAMIELLLDHGADPTQNSVREGKTVAEMAARRGRGDILRLLDERGAAVELAGVDRLLAACALGDRAAAMAMGTGLFLDELRAAGGTVLAQFAGNGNVEGLRCLLDLGVAANELYREGDGYFEIARDSTALHVAAWRAWPAAVKELLARGAEVNAVDAKGRTPLMLAVKACVDSYWKNRRSPESVEALLKAGARVDRVAIPSGYDEVDRLLRERTTHSEP